MTTAAGIDHPMRIIDVHCYPNTKEWIECQRPYVDALAKYWKRSWTAKTEADVVQDFTDAGVEAILVALDLETTVATPPCSNDFVAGMRERHSDRIIQAWAAVDPFKGEQALAGARHAIQELTAAIMIASEANKRWLRPGTPSRI